MDEGMKGGGMVRDEGMMRDGDEDELCKIIGWLDGI